MRLLSELELAHRAAGIKKLIRLGIDVSGSCPVNITFKWNNLG